VLRRLLEGLALALHNEGINAEDLAKVGEDLELQGAAVLRVELALAHEKVLELNVALVELLRLLVYQNTILHHLLEQGLVSLDEGR
jgi:hypothetical protein